MYWIAALTLWVVCAGVTAFIADKRGKDVGAWALIGLVFGIAGVIAVCVAGGGPSEKQRRQIEMTRRARQSLATNPSDWRKHLEP